MVPRYWSRSLRSIVGFEHREDWRVDKEMNRTDSAEKALTIFGSGERGLEPPDA